MTNTSNKIDHAAEIEAYRESQRKQKEWLANLKVGDEIAIMPARQRGLEIVKIERETAKFWIVGPWKYRKDDGHGIGGGRWSGPGWLHMPTDEIREANKRRVMVERLEAIQWRKAPMWALCAVTEALKNAKPITDVAAPVSQDAGHGHQTDN